MWPAVSSHLSLSEAVQFVLATLFGHFPGLFLPRYYSKGERILEMSIFCFRQQSTPLEPHCGAHYPLPLLPNWLNNTSKTLILPNTPLSLARLVHDTPPVSQTKNGTKNYSWITGVFWFSFLQRGWQSRRKSGRFLAVRDFSRRSENLRMQSWSGWLRRRWSVLPAVQRDGVWARCWFLSPAAGLAPEVLWKAKDFCFTERQKKGEETLRQPTRLPCTNSRRHMLGSI